MSGYNPSSNSTGNLPQSTVKYYDKKFVENLKANTPFVRCSERRDLPLNSGNQLELFMYQTFGPNTNQVSEGTVPSGITTSVLTTTATIGEYADYASFSSLSLATAIDNTVENVAKEMSYRLGQTLSALVRFTVDGANLIDSSVSVKLAATSTTVFTALTLNPIRSAIQSLAGRAVRPFNEGEQLFAGVIHPFAQGDVLNDTANNGVLDILKHTIPGLMKMDELNSADLASVIEFPTSGIAFFQSNLVTLTSNYNPGTGAITGLTALRTYIMGREGVISITLGARGDTSFGDGNFRNIRCYTVQNADPTVADPSGLIPGWTSYKVHFTTTLPPDTQMRLRYIDAASGIS